MDSSWGCHLGKTIANWEPHWPAITTGGMGPTHTSICTGVSSRHGHDFVHSSLVVLYDVVVKGRLKASIACPRSELFVSEIIFFLKIAMTRLPLRFASITVLWIRTGLLESGVGYVDCTGLAKCSTQTVKCIFIRRKGCGISPLLNLKNRPVNAKPNSTLRSSHG